MAERSLRFLSFAAAVLIAVPSTGAAQVLSLGDDGKWVAQCTAAQNQQTAKRLKPPTSDANRLSARASRFPEAYRPAFEAAAARYEISPDLLQALAWQESRFNASARSPKGAIGLMQLMPATARALGVDPHDPTQNINGGAAYLRYMLNAYDGRIDLALAAYNAGQGAVNRYGGIPPYKETRTYVGRNLDHLAALSDLALTTGGHASGESAGTNAPNTDDVMKVPQTTDIGPEYIQPCLTRP